MSRVPASGLYNLNILTSRQSISYWTLDTALKYRALKYRAESCQSGGLIGFYVLAPLVAGQVVSPPLTIHLDYCNEAPAQQLNAGQVLGRSLLRLYYCLY